MLYLPLPACGQPFDDEVGRQPDPLCTRTWRREWIKAERSEWLKRVFGLESETCPVCGGAVRVITSIEDPDVIEKILTHLDAKARGPETLMRPPCRAPPQRQLCAETG